MPLSNTVFSRIVTIVALVMPGLLHAEADDPADPPAAGPNTALRVGQQAARSTEFAVISPPDGITIALGGPGVDMPWIISPAVRGSGGVQGLVTLLDLSQVLLRLGAGWADVRSTRAAPPFQQAPARRWNLDGSELAWRHEGGEWYASVQRRNWGPGWTGSLILDGASQPVPAVGWRRPLPEVSASPWLQWMGPWTADVFFGRLFGHDQPQRPALIGMRLQMQPFDNLQLGISRTLQWGGHGITTENQPGNQLAGFDWRLQLGAEPGNAFYGQVIGEDERNYFPSAYIAQVGLETRWSVSNAEVHGFVEWNDLIASHAYMGDKPPGVTYTSSVYKRGYSHDRMPLGHPAGGDVTLGSVGLLAQAERLRVAVVASRGHALPTSQRFAAGHIWGLNGSLQLDIDPRQQLGAGLWWWRDSAQEQVALQAWWSARF
jgi:Capsule assembly protein Wzi